MTFKPNIEKRKEHSSPCSCGRDHDMKIIRGIFNYAEGSNTVFCAALIEHHRERHVWISFITGEWPGTNQEACYVTSHVWQTPDDQIMRIEDSSNSPFDAEDVFDCYPVSRDQVMVQSGAKEWFINTYLALFECDPEVGNYLDA